MIAIYKRELKNFFTTVTGWLFIAAHVCMAGLYFFAINLLSGYANVAETVSSILFLLLLTTPILSMRILAEERKQKTDQLTLTSPVSVAGIVMGKYFALATVFTVPIAVMCTFPLILSHYGTVPMGESYTAILVYYLFGLTCLAVRLLVSSITECPVIAAVLSFAVLFVGYMMSSITAMISSAGNAVTKVLSAFDFTARLNAMLGGTLDLKAVLYFLTVIAVCLFLTVQSIQKRQYHISVKSLSMGAYSTGMIAVVLVIAVFLNLAVSSLPDSYTTVDVTSQKLYSLTATTKKMLKELSEDVTIYVINAENNQDTLVGKTLESYADLSDHIEVVYKDPVVSPDFYKEYTDSISINSLIVECGDRFQVINYSDLYAYDFNSSTYQQTVSGYDAEGLLTSAIAYVTGENTSAVYRLEGYGEQTLEPAFSDGVKKENVVLENLYHKPALDEDKLYEELMEYKKMVEPYVCDVSKYLWDAIHEGKNILLEGQLGSMKDPDHGIYPMVTSSSTLAAYGAIGAGIPPYEIKEIIVVSKAYSSAVGAGAFVSEIFGDEADELRRRGGDGGEFGATTGRPRRMGWYDCVASKYGCRIQGATGVAFTVLDVLGYLDEIPVCTGYEIDGKVTTDFPTTHLLEKAKPVYEVLPGWKCDIRGIKKYEDLPENCRKYIEFIEKHIECPITMVSNGPGRDDIIFRNK